MKFIQQFLFEIDRWYKDKISEAKNLPKKYPASPYAQLLSTILIKLYIKDDKYQLFTEKYMDNLSSICSQFEEEFGIDYNTVSGYIPDVLSNVIYDDPSHINNLVSVAYGKSCEVCDGTDTIKQFKMYVQRIDFFMSKSADFFYKLLKKKLTKNDYIAYMKIRGDLEKEVNG